MGITGIYVYPASNSYNKTGGLCGLWNDNPDDDLYIMSKHNRPTIIDDLTDDTNIIRLGLFWRYVKIKNFLSFFLNFSFYENRLTSNPPKSQYYRKFEDDLYCPCDKNYDASDPDTWDTIPDWMNNAIGGTYCKKMVSKCALELVIFILILQ